MKLWMMLTIMMAVIASPAVAQIGQGGGPVLIDSDRSELRNDEGRAVFEGNVEATQGDARLRADRIEVEFERTAESAAPGSMGAMQRVIAIGEVYYMTPEETARSQRAIYEIAPNTLTLIGDVVVRQGCDVSIGERLIVDLATGNSQLTGRRDSGDGRVRVVLYPDGETESQSSDDCD